MVSGVRGVAGAPPSAGRLLCLLALATLSPQAAPQSMTPTCYPSGTCTGSSTSTCTLPTLPLVATFVQAADCLTGATDLCNGVSCCSTNGANCVYGCLYCDVRARPCARATHPCSEGPALCCLARHPPEMA